MRIFSLLIAVLLLQACGQPPEEKTLVQHEPRKVEAGIAQDVAVLRKQQVANPSYTLDITLSAEDEPFRGKVLIDFDYTPQGADLSVDFAKGEVLTVSVNGEPVAYDYNGFFLSIAEEHLTQGHIQLSVEFTHPYSKDGSGLYYFKDPIDDTVYTYSDLEPFSANKIFPLFDQPNLKASYTINADVPKHWQVVSTQRESSIDTAGERAVWHFPKTQLISSYVVSLHAGDYYQFDLGDFEGIDLRLFSRQSNKDYVPVEEWNQVTRQGFAFFNDFFGIAYPFGKFDQLAVPDFNSGAMENVGAVTFADQYCCTQGERSLAHKSFFINMSNNKPNLIHMSTNHYFFTFFSFFNCYNISHVVNSYFIY
mgnify:CR=1 FL=1